MSTRPDNTRPRLRPRPSVTDVYSPVSSTGAVALGSYVLIELIEDRKITSWSWS